MTAKKFKWRHRSRQLDGPRIKIPGIARYYRGLRPDEIGRLQHAVQIIWEGRGRLVPNKEFRELIEEKSRFIPKIWGGTT